MTEAATEQSLAEPEDVKVPVRGAVYVEKLTDKECLSSQVWHCPDCGGILLGEPLEDGLRCDACSISWSVGFMEQLMASATDVPDRPFVTKGENLSQIAIGVGQKHILLSTAQALLVASQIQHMAATGLVSLEA